MPDHRAKPAAKNGAKPKMPMHKMIDKSMEIHLTPKRAVVTVPTKRTAKKGTK